jgi:hypothetical protein
MALQYPELPIDPIPGVNPEGVPKPAANIGGTPIPGAVSPTPAATTPTNIPAVTPEEQARLDRLNLYGTNKDMYNAEITRINNALATGIGADGKPLNRKAASDWLARVQSAGQVWNAATPATDIPQIGDYLNPNQGKMDTVLGQIEGQGKFTDSPETNQSFQAVLKSMTEQGQRAARNTIGTMLGNSGWQTNTAVAAAAQQVAENAIAEAMSMYPAYREQAYNEYAGETKRLTDLYNILVNADETSYSRYVDMITQRTDEKKQAALDKQQDYENKQTELANQYDRIAEMGYVDNEASMATGIPVGTLSAAAKATIDQKNADLEVEKKKNDYELEQIAAQQAKEMSVINATAAAKGTTTATTSGTTTSGTTAKAGTTVKAATSTNSSTTTTPKPTAYKNDPDFLKNVEYIQANPDTAVNEIVKNKDSIVSDYGVQAYNELLSTAQEARYLTLYQAYTGKGSGLISRQVQSGKDPAALLQQNKTFLISQIGVTLYGKLVSAVASYVKSLE